MADDEIRYDYKAEIVRRGTEARVFATMQTEGWEFMREKPGLIKTQLMFRRPRPTSAGGHFAQLWTMLRTRCEAQAVLLLVGMMVVGLGLAIVGPTLESDADGGAGGGGGGFSAAAAKEATPIAVPDAKPVGVGSAPEVEEVLTKKNSKDLARLLAVSDPAAARVARFADDYAGRTIAFNGNFSAVANFDDFARDDCDAEVIRGCDFMVNTGDYDPDSSTGPNFKFADVDSIDGLHLSGSATAVRAGDEVRVVAVVDHYDSIKEHFSLVPISVTLR